MWGNDGINSAVVWPHMSIIKLARAPAVLGSWNLVKGWVYSKLLSF